MRRIEFISNFSAQCKKWFTEAQTDRSVRVFVKLVARLRQQKIFYQIISLILLLLLGAIIVLFFSSYLIWFSIKFVVLQVLLRAVEWYLHFTEKRMPPMQQP